MTTEHPGIEHRWQVYPIFRPRCRTFYHATCELSKNCKSGFFDTEEEAIEALNVIRE